MWAIALNLCPLSTFHNFNPLYNWNIVESGDKHHYPNFDQGFLMIKSWYGKNMTTIGNCVLFAKKI